MQNGTGTLERGLRSCFSATDLFAALEEHEDIISLAPITVLFIIWWKSFPWCFPSLSFPSSWLSHMQKQLYLLALEHSPPLRQHFFLSSSSHLSRSLQRSSTSLGRARVEYGLVRSCHLPALPTWALCGASVPVESPQRVPKSGCSTTQCSCPAALGNDALTRHRQRGYSSLALCASRTGQACLKTPSWGYQSWGFTDSYCQTGSLRDGNLLIRHITLTGQYQPPLSVLPWRTPTPVNTTDPGGGWTLKAGLKSLFCFYQTTIAYQ